MFQCSILKLYKVFDARVCIDNFPTTSFQHTSVQFDQHLTVVNKSNLFLNSFCRISICTHSPAGSLSALLCTLTISPLTRKTRSACSFRGDQCGNIHADVLDSPANGFCPSSFLRMSSSRLSVCITFHFQISQGRRSHHHSNGGDDRGGRREMGFSANARLRSS